MSPATAALPATFQNSRDFARIARAIRYIDVHYMEQPSLAEVARQSGLSEFHFNRLFRRWAGLTPKQYLGFVTGRAAKEALRADASVMHAAFAAGLSGPGRLHDLMVTLEALTPGEFKSGGAGTTVSFGLSDTPFGQALIARTPRGLTQLAFLEAAEVRPALGELSERWRAARLTRDDSMAAELASQVFGGMGNRTPVRLAVQGTNFQIKVWQALLELGARGATSYSEIARSLGMEGSERAVGNAVGANPIAYLIPCHRVLRKTGELGGYRWGVDRKRAMLAWERLAAGVG